MKTKWKQDGWTECNQECIINSVAEVLCMLPDLWGDFPLSERLKESAYMG